MTFLRAPSLRPCSCIPPAAPGGTHPLSDPSAGASWRTACTAPAISTVRSLLAKGGVWRNSAPHTHPPKRAKILFPRACTSPGRRSALRVAPRASGSTPNHSHTIRAHWLRAEAAPATEGGGGPASPATPLNPTRALLQRAPALSVSQHSKPQGPLPALGVSAHRGPHCRWVAYCCFQGSAQGKIEGVSCFLSRVLVASMMMGQTDRTATVTADSLPTTEV